MQLVVVSSFPVLTCVVLASTSAASFLVVIDSSALAAVAIARAANASYAVTCLLFLGPNRYLRCDRCQNQTPPRAAHRAEEEATKLIPLLLA